MSQMWQDRAVPKSLQYNKCMCVLGPGHLASVSPPPVLQVWSFFTHISGKAAPAEMGHVDMPHTPGRPPSPCSTCVTLASVCPLPYLGHPPHLCPLLPVLPRSPTRTLSPAPCLVWHTPSLFLLLSVLNHFKVISHMTAATTGSAQEWSV